MHWVGNDFSTAEYCETTASHPVCAVGLQKFDPLCHVHLYQDILKDIPFCCSLGNELCLQASWLETRCKIKLQCMWGYLQLAATQPRHRWGTQCSLSLHTPQLCLVSTNVMFLPNCVNPGYSASWGARARGRDKAQSSKQFQMHQLPEKVPGQFIGREIVQELITLLYLTEGFSSVEVYQSTTLTLNTTHYIQPCPINKWRHLAQHRHEHYRLSGPSNMPTMSSVSPHVCSTRPCCDSQLQNITSEDRRTVARKQGHKVDHHCWSFSGTTLIFLLLSPCGSICVL